MHRPILFLSFAFVQFIPEAMAQHAAGVSSHQEKPAVYRAGDRVQVRWSGGWYEATVLEVRGGAYKVRYAGYDSSWDEYVPPERIASKASRETSAIPERNVDTGLQPEGHYLCQAFEAGQLHNQGDFVVHAGGAYTDNWGRSKGKWSHDRNSGRMQFAGGSLSNGAAATLMRTAQGKTAIEFSWGGDVKRWCYKQSR